MSEDKVFRTSNYKLAAFLLAKNFTVTVHKNPLRPTKAEFIYSATDLLFRAIAEFNGNEPVPVQTFLESLEIAKDYLKTIVRGAAR